MDEPEPADDATLFPKRAGERLRDARIAQGLELSDLAARTRIRERYLQAIEDGDYGSMQSTTYAVGFAKSYARAVGIDEVEVAREVRGQAEMTERVVPEYQPYEMDDPSRLPSRGLTLVAVLLGLLVLAGVGIWYGTNLFRGDGAASEPVAAPTFAYEAEPTPTATSDVTTGQVTLVATDDVWLRVYDAAGTTLLLKTLAPGERYDVPAGADGPMINVGRPDKLQVLVNGSEVAPLGNGRVAIKDVGISAAALAARGQPVPEASAASAPAAETPAARQVDDVPPAFRAPRERSRPATPSAPTAGRNPAAPVVSDPAAAPAAAPGNSNDT